MKAIDKAKSFWRSTVMHGYYHTFWSICHGLFTLKSAQMYDIIWYTLQLIIIFRLLNILLSLICCGSYSLLWLWLISWLRINGDFTDYVLFYFQVWQSSWSLCTVFPNALNLRPTVFPRDNMFTDMVKVLYKTDTPTNVLPSIHVFNSIGAGIAISHSNDLKKHRWIQISAYILATLIILSTMFLKQHSVTDVIAAVTMACIIYPFVYVTADKTAPKLSAADVIWIIMNHIERCR